MIRYTEEDRNLLNTPKETIEDFLLNNRRKMKFPEYYYGVDNNQQSVEEFTDDRLKVLIVMLSSGDTRSSSNTYNALSYLVKKDLGTDKVFVDYCYFPERENFDILKSNNIPFIFGNITHETLNKYDLVLVSNAIIPEVANIPHYFKSSGIPLTIEERDKEDMPCLVFGGAAANEASIVLGKIYDESGVYVGKSLIDMANYGYGEERVTELANTFYAYKKAGINLKDKPVLKEKLIEEKVLYEYLFFPEKYEWVYAEDNFTIKEIKCLDDRLPKRVKYSKIEKDFEGFPLKTLHLSGASAHAQDVMVSSGCSGQSSTCSFCMEGTVAGYYYEKELPAIEEGIKLAIRTTAPNAISPYSFNLNYYKHFMDLIALIGKYSKSISMHNERIDVVANAPQQLELAKRVGLMRFAGAVEGMGERVRNGILNKNLTRETLMKAVRVIYNLKLMHFKMG